MQKQGLSNIIRDKLLNFVGTMGEYELCNNIMCDLQDYIYDYVRADKSKLNIDKNKFICGIYGDDNSVYFLDLNKPQDIEFSSLVSNQIQIEEMYKKIFGVEFN